jgi:hypothetical protein
MHHGMDDSFSKNELMLLTANDTHALVHTLLCQFHETDTKLGLSLDLYSELYLFYLSLHALHQSILVHLVLNYLENAKSDRVMQQTFPQKNHIEGRTLLQFIN